MKNFDSKLFRELKSFTSATRILITGTPLQNNLKELWSLLNFLLPNIFTDWEAFDSWFDFSGLEDEQGTEEFIANQMKHDIVKKIHLVLQPLLLRRVKADVARHLPKKREYVLFAPMTKEQTDLYNVINDKNVDTRAYLENKVVERLTGCTNSPAPSSGGTPLTSRTNTTSPEAEPTVSKANPSTLKLSLRSSPRSAKTTSPSTVVPAVKNAFAMMMGKKKGAAQQPKPTPKPAPAPVTVHKTPAKQGTKRKGTPGGASSVSKSVKSSRESTPASSRGRRLKGRRKYEISDASDDDLDDDAFESKLWDESNMADDQDANDTLSVEDIERASTLDLASKSRDYLISIFIRISKLTNSHRKGDRQ